MNAGLLWQGTAGPARTTPPRAPGSVRRTSSVDALWPEGVGGVLVVAGRARDLRTTADGHAEPAGEARIRVTVDTAAGRTVTGLDCDPEPPGLQALVGTRVGSGFRENLGRTAGRSLAGGGLLGLLLDEVPVLALLSAASIARAVHARAEPVNRPALRRPPPIDVCAGWAKGGALERSLRSAGTPALIGHEPPAPPLEDPADPDGWHPVPRLDPGSVRRRRRLDAVPGPRPGEVTVAAFFRDTYADTEGAEVILHEYDVTATVDRRSGTVTAAEAAPRVLPGPECPAAASSAARLVGRPAAELRALLRSELTGPATCTHLTDQLRALADVHALVPLLD